MNLPYNLINIFGPTASGKTSLSIELAKVLSQAGFNAEIINFDSLLFYKELNIGTAKPTDEEMNGVKHHFVGTQSISTPINSSDFVLKSKPLIEAMIKKNIIPILVGGSGFYLRALLKGMYSSEPTKHISKEAKEAYKAIINKNDVNNNEELLKFLKQNDPESLINIHQNDFYRLSRAVEYFIINQKKLSDQKKDLDKRNPYNFEENLNINSLPLNLYLLPEKSKHLEIILKRTEKMIDDGLISEVQGLLDGGFDKNLKPLNSIGYKETINFIDTKKESKKELIEEINISTRQLAKSQKTFFQKVTPKTVINPLEGLDKNIEKVFNLLSIT
jgi:tRNA dimethylallyltransferase